jgi:hypothetical protein
MAFQKAVKEQAKLRLALDGLAGSGKTFSALSNRVAISKLMREAGHGEGRIAVIDSERGSASLYADKFDFDVCELDSFSPLAYVDKIQEAERPATTSSSPTRSVTRGPARTARSTRRTGRPIARATPGPRGAT